MHPEITVIFALAVAFTFFALTAGSTGFLSLVGMGTYLYNSAQIGIIAAPATLLMIAGEFDLSIGSMVGAAEITVAYGMVELHWPLVAAFCLAAALACLVGTINAVIVVKTGLPSFIVTLGSMFILLGAAQGFSLQVMGDTTVAIPVQDLTNDPFLHLFMGSLDQIPAGFFWFLAAIALAAWILDKRPFGNWIYASGGNRDAATKAGISLLRVKLALYIFSSLACTVVACLNTFQISEANASDGGSLLFEVITAVVIGGTLLTGGLGSPIGTAFAAVLFGIVSQGFFFTNIPEVWYEAFVGAMLLGAVAISKYTGTITLRARTVGIGRG